MTEVKKRTFYLDVLRIIACLSVIVIHASGNYAVKDIGSFNFYVANFFDSMVRISVPIFVMISGCLMLDKNYKYSNKKIISHISKMIIFFLFWSILYSIIYNIIIPVGIKNESFSVTKFIKSIIKGHFHLWFVFMIVGLYLIVPLLRLWVNDKNKKYVEYFIVLAIIFSFLLPQIVNIGSDYSNFFKQINYVISNVNLKYIGGYTLYFILGWYLNNYKIKHEKGLYILGVIGFFATFIITVVLSNIKGGFVSQMYGNLTINVLFQTIMVFVLIKNKCEHSNGTNNKLFLSISNSSLGIYAIHPLFIDIFYGILIKMEFNIVIFNIPLIFGVSFLSSLLISYIMRKIPFLKKVV